MIPEGPTLGPLLFTIFMCEMFLILNTAYFTGFADGNTPFLALEEIGEKLVNWFLNNKMNLNTYKCHPLLNSQEPDTLKIGDLNINNSLSEKLLGITFGCKLKFNKHIEDIFQKPSQNLNALKTCTIHGNSQKMYSYECVFQVTI